MESHAAGRSFPVFKGSAAMHGYFGRLEPVSQANLASAVQETGVFVLLCGLLFVLLTAGALVGAMVVVRRRHQESRKNIEKWVEQARLMLKSPDLAEVAEAVHLLEAALERTPPWWEPPLVELKARALMRLHRYQALLELLRDDLPEHRSRRALSEGCCWSRGRVEEKASDAFWKSVLLGQACFHLGRLEDALTLLQRAKWHSRVLARNPMISPTIQVARDDGFGDGESIGLGPVETMSRLITVVKFLVRRKAAGEAAFSAGLFYEAVRQFTRVLDSRKGTPPALAAALYLRRAAAYERLARISEAIADCSRAAALEPQCPLAVWNRAVLYQSVGAHHESSRDLHALLAAYEELTIIPSRASGGKGRVVAPSLGMLLLSFGRWFQTLGSFGHEVGDTWGPYCLRQWAVNLSRRDLFVCQAGSFVGRCVLWCLGSLWQNGAEEQDERVQGHARNTEFTDSHWLRRNIHEIRSRLKEMNANPGARNDSNSSTLIAPSQEMANKGVDYRKILGLGDAVGPTQSRLAVETAFRVAMLRHNPDRAGLLPEKCAIADPEQAAEARAEVAEQDARLLRLVEAARIQGLAAQSLVSGVVVEDKMGDAKSALELHETKQASDPVGVGSNGQAAVAGLDVVNGLGGVLPLSVSKAEALESGGDSTSSSHSNAVFLEGAGRSLSAGTPSVGLDKEGREKRRWRPGTERGSSRPRKGVTKQGAYSEEASPLQAGECDSLLRGWGDVESLAGNIDFGLAAMLDNLDKLGAGSRKVIFNRKEREDGLFALPWSRSSKKDGERRKCSDPEESGGEHRPADRKETEGKPDRRRDWRGQDRIWMGGKDSGGEVGACKGLSEREWNSRQGDEKVSRYIGHGQVERKVSKKLEGYEAKVKGGRRRSLESIRKKGEGGKKWAVITGHSSPPRARGGDGNGSKLPDLATSLVAKMWGRDLEKVEKSMGSNGKYTVGEKQQGPDSASGGSERARGSYCSTGADDQVIGATVEKANRANLSSSAAENRSLSDGDMNASENPRTPDNRRTEEKLGGMGASSDARNKAKVLDVAAGLGGAPSLLQETATADGNSDELEKTKSGEGDEREKTKSWKKLKKGVVALATVAKLRKNPGTGEPDGTGTLSPMRCSPPVFGTALPDGALLQHSQSQPPKGAGVSAHSSPLDLPLRSSKSTGLSTENLELTRSSDGEAISKLAHRHSLGASIGL